MRKKKSIISVLMIIVMLITLNVHAFAEPDADISYQNELFTDRDISGEYDKNLVKKIELSDENVVIESKGTYILTGILNGGSVIVDVSEDDKVQIVLNGAEIISYDSAAILIKKADKVFITLAKTTSNSLAVKGEYINEDINIDAAIFSKCDLTLNGEGALNISTDYGHGIVCKKDLRITGGTYNIESADNGITGEKSLAVYDGVINITTTGGSSEAEMKSGDSAMGFGGNGNREFNHFNWGNMQPGSEPAMTPPGGMHGWNGRGNGDNYQMPQNSMPEGQPGSLPQMPEEMPRPDMNSEADNFGQKFGHENMQWRNWNQPDESEEESDDSTGGKGIKSDGDITIVNGTFTMDTFDDSFHCAGTLKIENGTFVIKSGDDGMHSDGNVVIYDGDFNIPYCYEGIEGLSITVNGGTFAINSTDDGMNAAQMNTANIPGVSNGNTKIVINDGAFNIVSSGDCIDSNGELVINGGTFELTCNSSMNNTLDSDGALTVNGGSFNTNDGAENGTGGMFGAHGKRW